MKILLTTLLLLILIVLVIIATPAGLRGAVWTGERFGPGELSVRDLEGRLVDQFSFGRLQYRLGELQVDIEQLTFAWRPLALTRGLLDIEILDVDRADILVPETTDDETEQDEETEFSLPLRLRLGQLNVGELNYRTGGVSEQKLHSIYASARTREQTLHIQSFSLAGEAFNVSLAGQLQLIEPWRHDVQVTFEARLPDQPGLSGSVSSAGDVKEARIVLELEQPSTAKLEIEARNVLQTPAWQASLQSEGFDLAPWLDSDTRAAVNLDASGSDRQIQSELELDISGEIEQRVHTTLHAALTEDSVVRIEQLDLTSEVQTLELAIQGEADWSGPPRVDIDGDWSIETPQPAAGRLALNGTLDDYMLELTAATDTPLASDWRIAANGSQQAIDIEQLSGQIADGTIEGDGRFAWQPAPTLSFNARWRDIAWPLGSETLLSPQGRISLQGEPADYTLEASGEAQHPAWPALDWQVQGQGDQERFKLDALVLKILDGQLRADGELAWADTSHVGLNIHLDAINPGAYWPDWPGQLNGRTRVTAQQTDADWQLQLQDLKLDGHLRDYPVSARGGVRATPDHYEFERLRLAIAESVLQASGRLADNSDLEWRFESPDLSQLLPEAAGRIDAEGQVRGRWTLPVVQARLKAQAVDSPWLALERLELIADVDVADERFDFDLNASDLVAADQTVNTIAVRSDGRLDEHRLQIDVQADERALNLAGRGQWVDPVWSLQLNKGSVRDPLAGEWQLESGLQLELQQDAVAVSEHCWRQRQAALCPAGQWQSGGDWAGQLDLRDYRIDENTPLPEDTPPLKAQVALSLNARGQADKLGNVGGRLDISELSIQPQTDATPTELRMDAFSARLSGNSGEGLSLDLDGGFAQPSPGKLEGRLQTGAITLNADAINHAPLDGRLRARIDDLKPWLALYPQFTVKQANLDMDFAVAGQVGNPTLDGALALKATGLGVPELGIRLKTFTLGVQGDTKSDLLLDGRATSGPGELKLDGRVALGGETLRLSELTIQGERFELVNLPEAWILASPDLKLGQESEVLDVTGKVVIPEALLQPLGSASAIPVSADERIVSDETDKEPPGSPFPIRTAITVVLGDEVRVTGSGFEGRIEGRLDIKQPPGKVASAQGEVRIVDGAYNAYGQNLTLETGQVIFTGQPIDDPAINAKATRTVGDVTAGIHATGTARQPTIELYSTPSLPEAEILSYIVTGRPLSGASSGEGDILLQAATSMGIKNSESLRQNIASSLGLDTLAIESGSGADGGSGTSLVIGKYLAPNLYISYGAGLIDAAANTVHLRYDITDYLSLEAEQGEGTGVDLLYQFER